MSDFERVDSFFGETLYEQYGETKYRQIRIDLGSAAIYWVAMQLDHLNPPETLRAIPVDVRRDLTVLHNRCFNRFRSKRFQDSVFISQGMGGEGMLNSDALYDAEDVAEFKQRHDISSNSVLSYMGISPPEPHMVSSFSFDMKGQIDLSRNDETTKVRFNEVMDFVEAHQTKSADMKA